MPNGNNKLASTLLLLVCPVQHQLLDTWSLQHVAARSRLLLIEVADSSHDCCAYPLCLAACRQHICCPSADVGG